MSTSSPRLIFGLRNLQNPIPQEIICNLNSSTRIFFTRRWSNFEFLFQTLLINAKGSQSDVKVRALWRPICTTSFSDLIIASSMLIVRNCIPS
ncbi:unnamed protein product [Tenebrio molitor]|nr:unnamed protein product [Tenebrio molitor]